MILQPGIKAPDFRLRAANLDREFSFRNYPDKKVVLVFFPSRFEDELADRLAEYDRLASGYEDLGAFVMAISDAGEDDLKRLAGEKTLNLVLLSDSNPPAAIAGAYGVLSADRVVLPAVFVIDEDGVIRRVYEASNYPSLPNPMIVRRFIITLQDAPKPSPLTEHDRQFGSPDGAVTLIEYSDYQCKHCIELHNVLKSIMAKYGGWIRLVHRHLPVEYSHPQARLAAEAVEAAGAQGKFWQMHHRLFEAKGALTRGELIEYARGIGLEIERFVDDLDHHRFKNVIDEGLSLAAKNKVKFPPALFINGILHKEARTEEALRARIRSLLDCTASFRLR